jgi:hypothetical protein
MKIRSWSSGFWHRTAMWQEAPRSSEIPLLSYHTTAQSHKPGDRDLRLERAQEPIKAQLVAFLQPRGVRNGHWNGAAILTFLNTPSYYQEEIFIPSKLIKLSLCFKWAPSHEGVLGSGGIALRIFYLGTRWRWLASRPGCFTPRERAPGTHWIGSWVGPRAVLDTVVKRRIPSPRRESNPRTPIVQPVAQGYTHWAITALNLISVVLIILISLSFKVLILQP